MLDKLSAIKEVQQAVEAAMAVVEQYLLETEDPTSEAARALIDETLASYGCESPLGCIVASGRDSAEPHHHGVGVIQMNTSIVIDIYPRSLSSGFYADMTRTICKGEPSPELVNLYETVVLAQELAFQMIQPGVAAKDVHIAIADYFKNAGFNTGGQGKEFTFAYGFVHTLGHGIGQAVHESPSISPKSDALLQIGDIITIEPGLYYPNIGGVRMEDMVVVTENGFENLTKYKKQFVLV